MHGAPGTEGNVQSAREGRVKNHTTRHIVTLYYNNTCVPWSPWPMGEVADHTERWDADYLMVIL